ncbi:unnamed protein product [Vitrella brassicaformis CCMP3155]|uniref:Potassium channel tetramerisation-type BTB domain-containing protein n=1 Tax=Vitrella brassicaformis (strain CCMP3155) TaxID=1169540 RepID=A0A0G4GN06_VITBC|nr:unnamed protein product [Vitrella brassicaformis CCMP3155]|eukprot:CEM31512.1 unnamed protein product [Vitrella brassicaformis CCMP3155]
MRPPFHTCFIFAFLSFSHTCELKQFEAASSTRSSQATGGTMSGSVTQINVGGYVMAFPSGVLLREGLRGTCVAVLLHRFDEWMHKDADGTIFIDADPIYFIWLCEKLCRLKHGWVDEIEMFDAVQPIPFYHDMFFAESPIAIDKPTEDSESPSAFRSFIAMMGVFIKSSIKGGRGGAEVLSVTVDGRTVATTDATLTKFDTLNDRFTKYGRTPIVDVSAHHFDLIVGFARRCRLSPDGAVVPPPTCADQDELVRVSEMYGVLEAMYPNILANDVLQTLLEMLGKKEPKRLCLFKSSLQGSSYASMAQRVVGRRGLLFVIKCDDTNTIAAFADTKLQLPADPTSQLCFCCPVSLFSVCGAFGEGITKIDVPQDHQQCVRVAGTQGAVTTKDGVPWGKVCIAGGRLWLGSGVDGPTDDLLRCHQWVEKKKLPANRKSVGKKIDSEYASLCGAETHDVAVQRVEVFQVWSAVPADPIVSDNDLRALVDATGMTDATPKLLYKGERDGWGPEAMFNNVGDATDLLLLLKDLGGPIIAAHIEGGLTPPPDPTGVAMVRCPVSLFSVCGAFEGDGITKIDLPNGEQPVWVAGTQGAVKNVMCEPVGKVCIGDMIHKAPGRLWLGFESADLRRCAQWLLKDRLPADKKYIGTIDNEGLASLASSFNFTLADMEIYTLQPSAGWHWVSAVAWLMMTSRSA